MRKRQVYKIIIRMQGGLGDQLFQYTAAMALHAQNSMRNVSSKVYVDKSWFTQKPNTSRTHKSQPNKSSSKADKTNSHPFLLDRLFPHITYIPTNVNATHYTHYIESKDKKRMFFDDFLSLHTQDVVLEGSFQNYRYYELAKEYIHPRLYPMPSQYKEIMKSQQLVSVYVRRGDYFDISPQKIAPIQYYKEAFRKIKEERSSVHVIVCGEDERWIEEKLLPELTRLAMPYSYERDKEVYHQMSIMAQCQHFINTDDTLSAYSSLLGRVKDTSAYIPSIHSLVGRVKSQDMIPKEWKILDNYLLYEGDERSNPEVSIIIPVYNTAEYLARCLDSASLQTEENIEIIAIDDVSPDNSWDIIQRYSERDARIIGIQHKRNTRAGGARNTGIERARGKYLFFLDSDDFIRHDAIEALLEEARKNPEVELISGAFWDIDKYDVINPEAIIRIQEVTKFDDPLEVPHNNKVVYDGERVCGVLWNRDLFIRTNIRFPEHQMFEDIAIIDSLLLNITTMIFVPERLVYYQKRATSTMGSAFSEEKLKSWVAVIQNIDNLQNTNISEKDRVIIKRKIYYVIKTLIQRIMKEGDRKKHPFSGITHIKEEGRISQVVYKTLTQREFPYEEQLQYVVSHSQDGIGTFLLIDYLEQEYLIRKQEDIIRNLKQNRWYIFGTYSSKEKTKAVLRVMAKKIRAVLFNIKRG